MNSERQSLDASVRAGHEPDQIYARSVSLTIAGLVAIVGLSLALVYGVLALLDRGATPVVPQSLVRLPEARPTGPQLIPDQRAQLEQLRRREDQLLNEYAWADPDHKFARIPIQRAMVILAERTLQAAANDQEPRDAK